MQADDGKGSAIGIPSFMIEKHDGLKLVERLMDNIPILLRIEWTLPSLSQGVVDWELWTTAVDDYGAKFEEDFAGIERCVSLSQISLPCPSAAAWRPLTLTLTPWLCPLCPTALVPVREPIHHPLSIRVVPWATAPFSRPSTQW